MAFWRKKPTRVGAKAKTLYDGVRGRAREERWYIAGQVPDTVDGRFDMMVLMLSLLTIRLERIDSDASRELIVALHELFVEDMDMSLRQIGVGDMVIGKHVGRTMSAFGGRLGAYRTAAFAGDTDDAWARALGRNLFREEGPPEAGRWAAAAAIAELGRLNEIPDADLLP
ncbi:ubiquinol-cytochrome C chaperone [Pacificimonas sp. WHA3]|uniref:Ubiquinol-cytochrome C chaperone n=1 Tax=Pacificimonas pallii TaxID=2827236 RepID=A0ABS6SCQ2_9SPHN|nr:ubiquinol-cytochrome C chaperone family protein [Pacificimonas pallii]MBV7256198.1 ubiquinol-cytochrome C chaperone [Pacificimonas pallii]